MMHIKMFDCVALENSDVLKFGYDHFTVYTSLRRMLLDQSHRGLAAPVYRCKAACLATCCTLREKPFSVLKCFKERDGVSPSTIEIGALRPQQRCESLLAQRTLSARPLRFRNHYYLVQGIGYPILECCFLLCTLHPTLHFFVH